MSEFISEIKDPSMFFIFFSFIFMYFGLYHPTIKSIKRDKEEIVNLFKKCGYPGLKIRVIDYSQTLGGTYSLIKSDGKLFYVSFPSSNPEIYATTIRQLEGTRGCLKTHYFLHGGLHVIVSTNKMGIKNMLDLGD